MKHGDPDVPETVGIACIRCPDCGMVHIALLDEDGEPLTEMTLNDKDTLKMALQLLHAVYPNMPIKGLVDCINLANVDTDVKH